MAGIGDVDCICFDSPIIEVQHAPYILSFWRFMSPLNNSLQFDKTLFHHLCMIVSLIYGNFTIMAAGLKVALNNPFAFFYHFEAIQTRVFVHMYL